MFKGIHGVFLATFFYKEAWNGNAAIANASKQNCKKLALLIQLPGVDYTGPFRQWGEKLKCTQVNSKDGFVGELSLCWLFVCFDCGLKGLSQIPDLE